jgi:hypothetical protein
MIPVFSSEDGGIVFLKNFGSPHGITAHKTNMDVSTYL